MAQVRDGGGAKSALGLLDEESMLLEEAEDSADVAKVLGHGLAVYQYVVDEDQHEPA